MNWQLLSEDSLNDLGAVYSFSSRCVNYNVLLLQYAAYPGYATYRPFCVRTTNAVSHLISPAFHRCTRIGAQKSNSRSKSGPNVQIEAKQLSLSQQRCESTKKRYVSMRMILSLVMSKHDSVITFLRR